jgi:hypothetical protein
VSALIEAMADADVVWGISPDDDQLVILKGRDTLQEILDNRETRKLNHFTVQVASKDSKRRFSAFNLQGACRELTPEVINLLRKEVEGGRDGVRAGELLLAYGYKRTAHFVVQMMRP